MNTQRLEIVGIRFLNTQNMIDAGIIGGRYQLDVVGEFPRSDKAGSQCSIAIAPATVAIHLEGIMKIAAGNSLEYNIMMLQEDPDILEQFIGGTIEGAVFQKQGDEYKLTEFSREVKNGDAEVGDVREVKENRFSLIPNKLRLRANAETVLLNKNAKAQAAIFARGAQNNVFAGILGGGNTATAAVETAAAKEEPLVWTTNVDTMKAHAEANDIDVAVLFKQNGDFKAGKSETDLKSYIEAML